MADVENDADDAERLGGGGGKDIWTIEIQETMTLCSCLGKVAI